jgi:RNA-directed DNA polymerase
MRFPNTRQALEKLTGLSVAKLEDIAASPEQHYQERVEWVKGKQRRLLVPNWNLKLVQIRLRLNLFRHLPPHEAAYAVRGRGAVRAATVHVGRRWFYHRDIKDFYPSVSGACVRERLIELDAAVSIANLLAGLLTVHNQLPQGAPTSPVLGEIALRRMDTRITGLLHDHGLVYTRYADDITVSGGRHLADRFASKLDQIIAECGWTINGKGGIFGPDERHEMLGLKVNHKLAVSDELFERAKYTVRLARKGVIELDEAQLHSLSGTIDWITVVDPMAGQRLRRELNTINSVQTR